MRTVLTTLCLALTVACATKASDAADSAGGGGDGTGDAGAAEEDADVGTDGTGGTDGTDGTDGDDTELPEAWSEHYFAETTIVAGGFSFDETYWVRRQLDPAAALITEELVATADGTLTVTVLVVDAASNTFTLEINDGQYTGTGELVGEPWAWTAWSSLSTDEHGHTVESVDTVTETGIRTEKTGRTPEGELEWTLSETLTTTDEATWAEGVAASGG
jgi:hypothetical protein